MTENQLQISIATKGLQRLKRLSGLIIEHSKSDGWEFVSARFATSGSTRTANIRFIKKDKT